jgi:hypothetical protein
MTREEWLSLATDRMRLGMFKRCNSVVPEVRLSVGFPGGARTSARKAIGQYWPSQAARDGVPQVFISPVLEAPGDVLATLVHELVHAVHPTAGHKGPFKALALALGLTGKMTATVAGPGLEVQLRVLAEELGPYPHGKLSLADRKKQTTRMLKVSCPSCPDYVARMSRKAIEIGLPTCPCGEQMVEG